ncbi:MAG: hypothetical protein U0892_16180, partial [Pirellulales bacterium]
CNRFSGQGHFTYGAYGPWLEERMFQMRHPWFCLLEKKERDFVRNADTAFCACITDDYSFACSQWWRCIESVLKRRLVEPIGRLIDENPQVVQSAVSDAPDRPKNHFGFVNLIDPNKRKHMSLSEILFILEAAMKDFKARRVSDCPVRRLAVEHLSTRMSEFRWVTGELDDVADFRSAITPRVFTPDTIKAFRNAASHDQPMTFIDAAIGRLIAIRILDYMHYPRYCVPAKLEELKQELQNNWPMDLHL